MQSADERVCCRREDREAEMGMWQGHGAVKEGASVTSGLGANATPQFLMKEHAGIWHCFTSCLLEASQQALVHALTITHWQ